MPASSATLSTLVKVPSFATEKTLTPLSLNEAENIFNKEIIALKADIAKLEALPKIIEQMVKPAEKIDSIRINHLGGGGKAFSGDGSKPPVNQALDSIMEMAVQLPALKKIGEELGLNVEDGLAGLTQKKGSEKD